MDGSVGVSHLSLTDFIERKGFPCSLPILRPTQPIKYKIARQTNFITIKTQNGALGWMWAI